MPQSLIAFTEGFTEGSGNQHQHQGEATTSAEAMSGIKTLCTQPGTLLDSRGLIADCGDYAAVCCVKSIGGPWVVKRSKTGKGFAILLRCGWSGVSVLSNSVAAAMMRGAGLDYTPSAFAAARNRLWIAKQDTILEHMVGEDDTRSLNPTRAMVVYTPGRGPGTAAQPATSLTANTCQLGRQHRMSGCVVYMQDCPAAGLYIITQEGGLHLLDLHSGSCKQLAEQVQPSSGLAVLRTSVLFISQGGDICALDIASHEVRVVGTDKVMAGQFARQAAGRSLALLMVPRPLSGKQNGPGTPGTALAPGLYSCNEGGQLSLLGPCPMQQLSSNLAVTVQRAVLLLTQAPGAATHQLCSLPASSLDDWGEINWLPLIVALGAALVIMDSRKEFKGIGLAARVACAAMGDIQTMCTQPGTLIECRGLFADCDLRDFVALCCVKEAAEGWVVKRYKSGEGFVTLKRCVLAEAAAADDAAMMRQRECSSGCSSGDATANVA
ncbi:hypothetical protein QJQ45_022626, partial [Haematococcus lacustris]